MTLATKHFVNGARLKPKIAFHGQTERTSDAYNCEIERLLKTDEAFDSLLNVLTATLASEGGYGTENSISSRVLNASMQPPHGLTRSSTLERDAGAEREAFGCRRVPPVLISGTFTGYCERLTLPLAPRRFDALNAPYGDLALFVVQLAAACVDLRSELVGVSEECRVCSGVLI